MRTPSPVGSRFTVDDLVADGNHILDAWLELRAGLGRSTPVPDVLRDEIVAVLAAMGRWIQSGQREPDEALRLAFRAAAASYRRHGYGLQQTLDDLADLEDTLAGDPPWPGDASSSAGPGMRRAMRTFMAEAVHLNHALDERRYREHSDALKTFGEILSHELGNRLGAARTGLDLLREPSIEIGPERREELLTLVADGINTALDTVDDVTAFMDAQEWTDDDAVPLSQVACLVVRGLRPVARRRGVVVEVEEPLPEIDVQGGRLRLVLSNLLVNGIRYADGEKDERWVRLRATRTDHALHLDVEDNGIGIPEDDRERIFHYHQRGHPDGELPRGSGLGLAIVREAIHQLGGDAEVDSQVGRGSRFRVVLPLNEASGSAQ